MTWRKSGYLGSLLNKRMKVEAVRPRYDSSRRVDEHGDCSNGRALTRVRISVGAEDLVQKTFLVGVRSLEKYSGRYSDTAAGLREFKNTIFLTEWEFLSQVVDPYNYPNDVPHHRVGQIHIAGHSKFEKYILDTQDHPVLDGSRVEDVCPGDQKARTHGHALEWDDRIPSFDEVHSEALKAKKIRRTDASLQPYSRLTDKRCPIPIGTEDPPKSDGSHSVSSAHRSLEYAEAHG